MGIVVKMFDESSLDEDMRGNRNADRGFNSRPTTANADIAASGRHGASSTDDASSPMSRARALAQQRDIQLRKRQFSLQSGGMVQASESNTSKPSTGSHDAQFTPAVRQFSAPKVVKDADYQSEFSTASRRNSNFVEGDDDEDDDRINYSSLRTSPKREPRKSYNPQRYSDDEDDEDEVAESKAFAAVVAESKDYSSTNKKVVVSRAADVKHETDIHHDELKHDASPTKSRALVVSSVTNQALDFAGSNPLVTKKRAPTQSRPDKYMDESENSRDDKGTSNNSAEEKSPLNRLSSHRASADSKLPKEKPDLSNMKAFLISPVPKNVGVVQCSIVRIKSKSTLGFSSDPIYLLYLESSLEDNVFLLASKKRPNNKTSNYIISMSENDLNKESDNYIGKLRSNFVGTEFQIYDNGINPKDGGNDSNIRLDLGAITYVANVLGSRGPRKMKVALPKVENDEIMQWKCGAQEDILTRMKDGNYRNIIHLINKPPRWNEQNNAYVLNFNGRVTMASVKNFQLVDPDDQERVILQFGRILKDKFTMDLQWPMSPLQAFAITLSSFDSKIACD